MAYHLTFFEIQLIQKCFWIHEFWRVWKQISTCWHNIYCPQSIATLDNCKSRMLSMFVHILVIELITFTFSRLIFLCQQLWTPNLFVCWGIIVVRVLWFLLIIMSNNNSSSNSKYMNTGLSCANLKWNFEILSYILKWQQNFYYFLYNTRNIYKITDNSEGVCFDLAYRFLWHLWYAGVTKWFFFA